MMQGNPHYSLAQHYKNEDDYGQARGLIEATLALAHEQRTANLLAWWRVLDESGCAEEALDVAAEIQERLGGAPDYPPRAVPPDAA